MIGDYRRLTANILDRLNPENLYSFQKAVNEELGSIAYSDVLQYVRLAMEGVSEEYTRRSKEAGENVTTHLRSELSQVSYKFQGSVMTNTHIKGYSDIDLLVLTEKSYNYDPVATKKYIEDQGYRSQLRESQVQKLVLETQMIPYKGDQLQDLRNIRFDSERILRSNYTVCDTSKSKCIRITNKNLGRDVDIVVACWFDDVRSIIFDKGANRGIQVYFKDEHTKGSGDFPFISIERINERGKETNDRLKKMIRFLKNIKSDADISIDLSSFDLNAICYNIDPNTYIDKNFRQLVAVVYLQLHKICTDTDHADSITSIDDREYIFKGNSSKLNNVRNMLNEVSAVYLDLQKTPIHT